MIILKNTSILTIKLNANQNRLITSTCQFSRPWYLLFSLPFFCPFLPLFLPFSVCPFFFSCFVLFLAFSCFSGLRAIPAVDCSTRQCLNGILFCPLLNCCIQHFAQHCVRCFIRRITFLTLADDIVLQGCERGLIIQKHCVENAAQRPPNSHSLNSLSNTNTMT